MTVKNMGRMALGVILSLVLLYFAVSGVEWRGVVEACRNARPLPLLVGTLLFLASWWLSACRWKVLLNPAPKLRVLDTFSFICIGYLANTVLPLRMGDLARAGLFGKKKAFSVSRVLASLAIERIWDVVALLLIAAPMIFLLELPGPLKAALASMAGAAVVGVLGLTVLSYRTRLFPGIQAVVARLTPLRIREMFRPLVADFCDGLAVIRRRSDLVASWFYSIASWAVAGCSAWLWALSFGLPVPWYAGFFVLVVVNLGSALPSSPGYIGVYHYLAVTALSLWVSDREACLAYALGTHGINMIANLALGGYFLYVEEVRFSDLKQRKPGAPG